MLIIPTIYIQQGRAVSLYKGQESDQKKVYARSPYELAREFVGNGASLIQIVDLDGSHNHGPENLEIIRKITNELEVSIELGGGIRDMETLKMCFDSGVARVILGVSALSLIPEALKKYGPERIIFGIKARRSLVESDHLPPDSDEVVEIAEQVVAQGITQIVYKDMEVQGALYHPNYDDVDRLILILGPTIKIISSGGVTSMSDLAILHQIKAGGVNISRALIEHKLSLSKAIDFYETDQDRALLFALPATR